MILSIPEEANLIKDTVGPAAVTLIGEKIVQKRGKGIKTRLPLKTDSGVIIKIVFDGQGRQK